MAEYAVIWRLVFDADDDEDARRRHMALLDAQDDLDASISVWGDGPQPLVRDEPDVAITDEVRPRW